MAIGQIELPSRVWLQADVRSASYANATQNKTGGRCPWSCGSVL